MTFQEEREAVCRVGKLLYDRGYVAANDGNISVRVGEGRLLITPSGVSKGRMTPDMLLVTDLDGTVIEGNRHPSSEGKMHLEVYRGRPDVNAVVHAHPPVSTAFAVCRRGLETPYLSELVAGLGQVPCTPSFAMLSTEEVPQSVRPYLADHNALLLANHGALAWGGDLWEAFDRLETVEHTAKIVLNAQLLGGGVPLTEEEVARLQGLRGMYQTLREVRHG
ncbi:class II aldolase/adducin family protein [Oscillibacter sp.]|uniref:class II aldolase/adducin family protein n=1 Tax=Oscillibacter sp. TaxID=1945593 RepID=UPI001B508C01|nr:class II aldolase/adducin family protein [Oscillibacter sp.]MBP3509084.1 class II aldolase/adducin family protein [Oscillibacter sp.]